MIIPKLIGLRVVGRSSSPRPIGFPADIRVLRRSQIIKRHSQQLFFEGGNCQASFLCHYRTSIKECLRESELSPRVSIQNERYGQSLNSQLRVEPVANPY